MMKKFIAIACACLIGFSTLSTMAQYGGGGGGGSSNIAGSRNSTLFLDTCPDGDYSPSFYDGECGTKPEYDLSLDLSITDPYTCGGDIFGRVISDDLENTQVTLTLQGDQSYSFLPALDTDGMYRQDVSTVADGQYTVSYTARDIHGNSETQSYTAYIQASCMIDAPEMEEEETEQEFNNLLDTGAPTINPNEDVSAYILERNNNNSNTITINNNNGEEIGFFVLPEFLQATGSPVGVPFAIAEPIMQPDIENIIKTVTASKTKTKQGFDLPMILPMTGASL